MSQQKIIEEIRRLSVKERIAIIEAISGSLREDLEDGVFSPDTGMAGSYSEEARAAKGAAVGRLRGALKTEGLAVPSDEELKDDYANYLAEKYS